MELAELERFEVPNEILRETWEALRAYGVRGCEGLVLWAGTVEAGCGRVRSGLVPPQNAIRDERGVGYFVTGETLHSVNVWLADRGLRLLAQVHSHPTEAYHSDADDRFAIVTTEGGISVVVPDFAAGAPSLAACAAYRLGPEGWVPARPSLLRESE